MSGDATVDQILFRKALVEEGALWKIETLGIKRHYLRADVQRAWLWVEEFQRRNDGDLPSDIILCHEMEWDDTPVDEFELTLKYVADNIQRRETEKRLIATMDAVNRELSKGQDFIFSARQVLVDMADDLRSMGDGQLKATNLFELYPETLINYADYKAGDIGLSTPWETMTQNILGYQPGQVIFFCGRPQTGKSWTLLLNCLHSHALGQRVLLITPELTEVETAERCMCIQTKTSYAKFTRGELDPWSEEAMNDAVEELKSKKGFWVADSTMEFNMAEVESLITQYDPDIIAIDSVYCFGEGRNRNEKIQNVVPWLIRVARGHGRPRIVMATTQMNRSAVTAETTTMENIYGSDAIGQDAHVVYGMYQTEEMYRDRQMGITQIKVRRGTRHEPFYTNWDLDLMNFSEITETGYERDEDESDDDYDY